MTVVHAADMSSTRIQSVDRAIDLLQAIAEQSRTVPQLAKACGLNRATAWRLLKTLRARGLVVVDEQNGSYSIGPAVLGLSQPGSGDVIAAARAHLERLCRESGETASLAMPRPEGLTYLDEVVPPVVLAASWLGRAVALHATSTGKVYLAHLPRERVESFIAAGLEKFTATTITDPTSLREELFRTREQGYGICQGELEASLSGVSAAVLDRAGKPLAVLSIWGPTGRVTADRFSALGAMVAEAAESVRTVLRQY